MFPKLALISFAFTSIVVGQLVGTYETEIHPRVTWQRCTRGGSCQTVQGSIVLDANWRWVHGRTGYTNCYTGNSWDTSLCPNNRACAENCALEGATTPSTYGITTSGNSITLKFIQPNSNGKNVGSRVYLMASDTRYQMFNLLNQEFTFDVDVSKLPCGLNGATYFAAMDTDGGMARFSTNRAGARYGTGYCDAQCARDIKFINREGNTEGWTPSETDVNAGTGKHESCCHEMDIWEANSISTAYTPHSCDQHNSFCCSNSACGGRDNRYGSQCDPNGCDFNSFRLGDKTFYGPGMTIDTNTKITVITQFLTDTGTASGNLKEIRHIYVQNGHVIQNSKVNIPSMDAYNLITEPFCTAMKVAFKDRDSHSEHGGLASISQGMKNGMVFVMSIWDDHTAHMLWLDSNYPVDADPNKPGIACGTCPTSSGVPSKVKASMTDATVTYSNIKFSDINLTY
ncbi:unnamed protein product [Cyclocybe aegerita]|uniref:Glucanase n=1 Tax=Cyclocybe aegerita TaxID=1973307 RepID=A0A8S0WTW4_CYCAE|nr:unnamed protein product [Cyclocybe aegerita]